MQQPAPGPGRGGQAEGQPEWGQPAGPPSGWGAAAPTQQPGQGWGQAAPAGGWGQQAGAPPAWEQPAGAPPAWGQAPGAPPAWGQPAGGPQSWGQPGAPAGWPADDQQQTRVQQAAPGLSATAWVPPIATPRRSKRPLLIGLAAVVVLALVAGGLFLLLRPDSPTWDGRTIAQPESVLSDAEQALTAYAEERNGVTNDSSACWFEETGDGSDVRDSAVCGPVLFVDGDPEQAYLRFGLTADDGSGDARLTVSDEPESPDPSALPNSELLTRPDGRTPPDGAGGLEVPTAPAADPGAVLAGPFEDLDFTEPTGPATLVGPAAAITVTGLARPDRVGNGDDARRPADGEVFLAVRYTVEGGAGVSDVPPSLGYRVGEADTVPVDPALVTPGATVEAVVSAPADVTLADLVVVDGAFTQTLSLLDGAPGAGNIVVLTRTNVSQLVDANQSLSGNGTSPGLPVPTPVTLSVTVNEVRLQWFPGTGVTVYPSAPDRAFLMLDEEGTTGLPGSTSGRSPSSLWSLVLPDGTVVGSQDLAADPLFIATGFDVPADFTTGTLVFGGVGTYVDGGVLDFGGATVQFPVEIPAG
ncbi:hypothetical protein GB931_12260 [Modestobacter sp. I12A-02628]|uniref:Uncharacterized protein n=1 Tax=Goekera deserti TaxID=2497753 RepID=A0A7K3W9G0_9ACTN|nr:hypothetical protein [Goekera deserti]MPQ98677.1 hypothetical protein [Goekera deserti]NDI49239.1 hypothetical protein [Goekera deserti]NEL52977.1 hypothetical protein [Goekera deserti]